MEAITEKIKPKLTKSQLFWKDMRKRKTLVFMSIPIIVYVFIFNYYPLWGLTMAFQNFRPGRSFSEQKWVGMRNFEMLFKDSRFILAIRNTVAMSIIILAASFITAIALAILLNEVQNRKFKKIAQSVTYLPHFLSWVIVCGLAFNFLGTGDGIINVLLKQIGILEKGIPWLGTPELFWWVMGALHVWKELGWNSIIYLASISAISPELYEAAHMDGANRFQKIRYITLPGIKSTVIVLLIMNLGFILNAGGVEPLYLLQNGIVADFSETIDIFVLRYGIAQNNFSYATAAGMFKSVVSIIMITLCSAVSKKMGEESLM